MKVYYDKEVDALYLKLGNKVPEGVIEIWKLNFGLSIKPIKSPHKFLPLDGGG